MEEDDSERNRPTEPVRTTTTNALFCFLLLREKEIHLNYWSLLQEIDPAEEEAFQRFMKTTVSPDGEGVVRLSDVIARKLAQKEVEVASQLSGLFCYPFV